MSEQITSLEQKEKTAQLAWTALILLFFVIQAIIWTVAITLTANDKSNAVIAGYDEKALHWDDEMALRAASGRLGWQSVLQVDPAADIQNIHVITLTLQNADRSPITDANVQLTAFHRALAGEPQTIQLAEVGKGVYSGKLMIRKSGLWQFEGSACKSEDTFLIKEKLFLNVSK